MICLGRDTAPLCPYQEYFMKYDPQKHHRRSIRLKGYDYTQPGAYFITICAYHRMHVFGEVINGEMVLNETGKIARHEWFKTAEIRPYVKLYEDEFVIMPNHGHGIIRIIDQVGTPRGGVQNDGVQYEDDIIVYQSAVFSAAAKVGEGSVVLVGALVGHACKVGQYCIMAPGSVLNARVELGELEVEPEVTPSNPIV